MARGEALRRGLGRLDERVGLRNHTNLAVAPPAWQPADGALRPVLLTQTQRLAVWGVAGSSATLSVFGVATGPDAASGSAFPAPLAALLVVFAVTLAGVALGARLGERQRRRPPALRWLAADTPCRPVGIFSPYLGVGLGVVIVTASALAVGAPRYAFVSLLSYSLFLARAEAPTRRRWARVEASSGGRVLRLSGRDARTRGTSGLYFRPDPVGAVRPSPRITGDASNPYRAPSRL